MKILVPPVEQRPVPTPYSNLNFDTGQSQVTQAMGNLGGSIEKANERIQEVKQRADATLVNSAISKLQDGTISELDGDSQKGTPGYLSSQGLGAVESSAKSLENMDKLQTDLSGQLASDGQRKLFAVHSQNVMRAAKERVESHVMRQREVAEEASIAGRMSTGLNAIANDYTNDKVVGPTQADVGGAIAAMAKSPEDAAAKVQAWDAKVAEVRLNQYLGAKDLEGAQNLFARVKDQLGEHAAQYEQSIGVERRKHEADRTALELMNEHRSPESGFVDTGKAIEAFQALPEAKRTDEAEHAFMKWLSVEQQKRKVVTDSYADSALRNYNANHSLDDISSKDQAWLMNNAPDEWRKLDLMARADAKAANPRTRHVETPAEVDNLVELRARMSEHADDFRDMTPEQFKRDFRGGLSDAGYKEAGRIYAELKKQPKGTGAEFTRFVSDEVKENGALKDKTTGNKFKGYMGDLRRDFLIQHKREPSLTEMQDMKASAWKDTISKGWLWDSHKPAFQNPGASAAGPATSTGNGGEIPAPAAPKPSKRDRALQLQKSGKSVKDIVSTLNAEGY